MGFLLAVNPQFTVENQGIPMEACLFSPKIPFKLALFSPQNLLRNCNRTKKVSQEKNTSYTFHEILEVQLELPKLIGFGNSIYNDRLRPHLVPRSLGGGEGQINDTACLWKPHPWPTNVGDMSWFDHNNIISIYIYIDLFLFAYTLCYCYCTKNDSNETWTIRIFD